MTAHTTQLHPNMFLTSISRILILLQQPSTQRLFENKRQPDTTTTIIVEVFHYFNSSTMDSSDLSNAVRCHHTARHELETHDACGIHPEDVTPLRSWLKACQDAWQNFLTSLTSYLKELLAIFKKYSRKKTLLKKMTEISLSKLPHIEQQYQYLSQLLLQYKIIQNALP